MSARSDRALISGIGISQIGRRLGLADIDLTTAACRDALADASLEPSDVDAVATIGDTPPDLAAEALGIEPRIDVGLHATSGLLAPVMAAVEAVTDGRARHVLVYRTVQMMGGTVAPPKPGGGTGGPGGSGGGALTMGRGPLADIPELLAYHSYSAANWVGMHCARHMHRYGTTREQLGALAVHSRKHAALNPLAAYRDPITLDDYLNARRISSPFGLLDCDVPVDGSFALVFSAPDFEADCPSPPVRVEAFGGHDQGGWFGRPDYPRMASVEAGAEMWSRTDLTPADVDVAQLYDGFTFLTIAWLEALGLCGEGEGGPFVADAERISLGGSLPLNTYGGQLSAGRMHGYWVLHEAALQLRGQAGERQVPNGPEVAAVAAGGGPIAGCLLLTT